jgi:hypothetical protein
MSEYDAFGIHVSKKLAKMDPVQAVYAKYLISGNIRKGLLKTLTDGTDFCENGCNLRRMGTQYSQTSSASSTSQMLQPVDVQGTSDSLRSFYESTSFNDCTINKMCLSYHVDDKLCNFVHNNKHLDS